MARKIELDLAKVESLAAQGLTEEQIASALGISPRTLTNRKREVAEFAEAIKMGRAKGVAVVTSKLMEQVKGGNVTAMIFFLKARAGWSDKQVVELSGPNGSPVPMTPTVIELVAPDVQGKN